LIYRIRHHNWSTAAIALCTVLLMPGSIWSWGRLGHRVVAKIAEESLTHAASAAVRNLLGPEVSLADISTWADEQHEIPRAGPWHYVNVPITESRYDPKFCQSGGCNQLLSEVSMMSIGMDRQLVLPILAILNIAIYHQTYAATLLAFGVVQQNRQTVVASPPYPR
jgi:hypothetical protein